MTPPLRTPLAAGALLLVLTIASASAQSLEPLPAIQFPLQKAWHNGTQVSYYQFGETSDAPAPVYAFFYANGTQVPGQRNLFDAMRRNIFKGVNESPDYSDFWLLHKVTVPDNYTPNTVRSKEALNKTGYPVEKTTVLINCPFVPHNSTLQDDPAKRPLQRGWFRGTEVHYYIFESNLRDLTPDSHVPDLLDPKTSRVKLSTTFEFGEELEKAGQLPIVDSIPGEKKYSPLWTETYIKAPPGYTANTLKGEKEVAAKLDDKNSGYTYTTHENTNFPIVGISTAPKETPTPPPPATPAPPPPTPRQPAFEIGAALAALGALLLLRRRQP